MLVLGLVLTIVALAVFGAVVNWWGRREFRSETGEASTEGVEGLPSHGPPGRGDATSALSAFGNLFRRP